VLMELAIAALNARLLAGADDILQYARRPQAVGRALAKVIRHVFFTSPFNITGQPAISLPLHRTPEGLPVGVQLVAAMGREDLLIRIASQLEQEQPWIDRLPPVHA